MNYRLSLFGLFGLIFLGLILSACSNVTAAQSGADGKLDIVATTSIVGDVVANIAGDRASLSVLIAPNVDEHAYQPSPRDTARIADADIVFMNGAGLEEFMNKLVTKAGGEARLVPVSDGIQLQESSDDTEESEAENHSGGDPHVWTDPNNVLIWVDNIEQALRPADPANAATYSENAAAYRKQLEELDGWVKEQVSQVPPEQRKLVTDHPVFTYFASRYGFEQVGAVIPGYSTLSEPSAQELAELEDTIQELGVPVIFVGNTVNPALSERIAHDTRRQAGSNPDRFPDG